MSLDAGTDRWLNRRCPRGKNEARREVILAILRLSVKPLATRTVCAFAQGLHDMPMRAEGVWAILCTLEHRGLVKRQRTGPNPDARSGRHPVLWTYVEPTNA